MYGATNFIFTLFFPAKNPGADASVVAAPAANRACYQVTSVEIFSDQTCLVSWMDAVFLSCVTHGSRARGHMARTSSRDRRAASPELLGEWPDRLVRMPSHLRLVFF